MFKLTAYQIFNSRAEPTLKVVLETNNYQVSASVPTGASKSTKGAVYLDSIDDSIRAVEQVIYPAIKDMPLDKPEEIDRLMIKLDGTDNKSRLGAGAILAVSIAVYRLAAKRNNLALYEFLTNLLGQNKPTCVPRPLVNLINGGAHADQAVDFQEYQLIPLKGDLEEQLERTVLVQRHLKKLFERLSLSLGYGDEGGFRANFKDNRQPLILLTKAVTEAGFRIGEDFGLGLDLAANNFYTQTGYHLREFDQPLDAKSLINYYHQLVGQFDIRMMEDPLAEADPNWSKLSALLVHTNNRLKISADDLTATHPQILRSYQAQPWFQAVIVKPNQVGTITETLEFVKLARQYNLEIIVSHRSGETCDDFIADLAVAVGAEYVKFGALRQSERLSKYNRLLVIKKQLDL